MTPSVMLGCVISLLLLAAPGYASPTVLFSQIVLGAKLSDLLKQQVVFQIKSIGSSVDISGYEFLINGVSKYTVPASTTLTGTYTLCHNEMDSNFILNNCDDTADLSAHLGVRPLKLKNGATTVDTFGTEATVSKTPVLGIRTGWDLDCDQGPDTVGKTVVRYAGATTSFQTDADWNAAFADKSIGFLVYPLNTFLTSGGTFVNVLNNNPTTPGAPTLCCSATLVDDGSVCTVDTCSAPDGQQGSAVNTPTTVPADTDCTDYDESGICDEVTGWPFTAKTVPADTDCTDYDESGICDEVTGWPSTAKTVPADTDCTDYDESGICDEMTGWPSTAKTVPADTDCTDYDESGICDEVTGWPSTAKTVPADTDCTDYDESGICDEVTGWPSTAKTVPADTACTDYDESGTCDEVTGWPSWPKTVPADTDCQDFDESGVCDEVTGWPFTATCTSCDAPSECNDFDRCTKQTCTDGFCRNPVVARCPRCSVTPDCAKLRCKFVKCIEKKCVYTNKPDGTRCGPLALPDQFCDNGKCLTPI